MTARLGAALAAMPLRTRVRTLPHPARPLLAALPLALLPIIVSGRISTLNLANYALIYSVVAVGLQLLYGTTGLMSLAQATFLALGAYTVAILTTVAGVPHLLAFALAIAIPASVAFPLGWFISRIRGYYLAVATLALAGLFSLWIRQPAITGGTFGITGIPPPSAFGITVSSPASFYLLALAVAAGVTAFGAALHTSRVGRALHAIGQSEAGSNASGVNLALYKASVFALSAGLAGAGGALYAFYVGFIGPETFGLQTSILLLTMVIVGGSQSIYGAILGAVLLTVLPDVLESDSGVSLIAYAFVLVAVFVLLPEGLVGLMGRVPRLARAIRSVAGRPGGTSDPGRVADSGHPPTPGAAEVSLAESSIALGAGVGWTPPAVWTRLGAVHGVSETAWSSDDLIIAGLAKRFAGLRVFSGIDLRIQPGAVTAIIGPNGAGKTTLFRIISGSEQADAGSVRLGHAELTRLQPYQICRLGVGRVFQQPQVCPAMTVRENIMLGMHTRTNSGFLSCGLRLPGAGRQERLMEDVSEAVLEMVGLQSVGNVKAGDLPFGFQRLVEVGRAIAPHPRWLLLDEPTAGLNPAELLRFKALLQTIVGSGVSVLLVEHNVQFVVDVSARAVVLSAGSLIFDGKPAEAMADPAVVTAYLGA